MFRKPYPMVSVCGGRRRRGLSLIELLLATAILTVCLVFVITLLLGLFRSSTKGEDQTIALEIADRLLSQISNADPSKWDLIASDPNVLYTHDPRSQTVFKTDLDYLELSAAPADTATTPQMGDIYDVTVDVSWWAEDGTTSRRGYGLQKVTLKRTVYVEMSP